MSLRVNRWRKILAFSVAVGSFCGFPASAQSQSDLGAEDANPADAARIKALQGLTLGAGLASAYNSRGLNVYQANSQGDQHSVLAPTLVYNVPGVPLTIAYGSAYQVTGTNRQSNVDDGTSHEQSLVSTWLLTLNPETIWGLQFGAIALPFASPTVAETAVPLYLEPATFLNWSNIVDITFTTLYSHAVQDPISDLRYFNFRPAVSKRLALTGPVSFIGGVAYGYKAYVTDYDDNVNDVVVDAAVPIEVNSQYSLSPGAHWAWSDLKDKPLSEQQFFWASVDLAYAF